LPFNITGYSILGKGFCIFMSELRVTKEAEGAGHNGQKSQVPFGSAPIIEHKFYDKPSVFTPENLLREARRQKGLAVGKVPAMCVLDPDGDLVDYLHTTNCARVHPTWACYHTALDTFVHEGMEFGVIGRVVGASFAVLVAEELFASGCELLISITSAGQIISLARPPYVVLIEKALRDEGTSYHYLPPSSYSYLHSELRRTIYHAWDNTHVPLFMGASWTTDAPFRETEEKIARCRESGILSVEMEAAALYALAEAKRYKIICFAHVTNQMGQVEGDFEKGQAQGNFTALNILTQTALAWQGSNRL
jgi:uridine phosphorylase